VKVSALWLGKKILLGALNGGEIASWKLQSAKTGWKATRQSIAD
jgi:hypothetical protein